jgi:hypothetical protein
VPRARCSFVEYSLGLCVIPSTLGTNNIALGHNAATSTESWPAAAIISRVENWRACALLRDSESFGSNVTGPIPHRDQRRSARAAEQQYYISPHEDRLPSPLADEPGLSLEAAQWLVEGQKAMLLGADSLAVESFPSSKPDNFVPVHSYLLVERGVSIMEALWLEDLAKDGVYEFLFIASPLKFRGGTASPVRPLAISLQH